MANEVHVSLVIDTQDSYDENSLQVVDLKSIQMLAPNVFVIQTKNYVPPPKLINGAGDVIEKKDLLNLLSTSTI